MEQRSNSANGEAGSAQLERSLDILELLAESAEAQGLTDIAQRVGGPKATVHRLLTTLQARGYVSQEPRSSRYTIGLRCFELGRLWTQHLDLRRVAASHLAALNEDTGETVHLALYDQGDVIYIDKLESRHPVVAKSSVGGRCPSTCVATGRALLASQPADEIDRVLRQPLPAYTPDSITDRERLEQLLEEVRRNGYAVNHNSYRIAVGGVAAPIRDHTGAVVASVGVCLPEHRFGPDRFDELVARVIATATGISGDLGGPSTLVTSTGRRVTG